jgi:hypothetical protein
VSVYPWRAITSLDLLLVIDDSGSMAHEAQVLVEELPRLFAVLTRGDLEGDGALELVPFQSIHAGVVTTDLGAGPHDGVPTCAVGLGDDGILRRWHDGGAPGCFSTHPSGIFTLERGEDAASELAFALGCVAGSTGGCMYGQPLESALKALSPIGSPPWTAVGYEAPRFLDADGRRDVLPGHGEGANQGFLRPNSVLVILVLEDEDDCSVEDYGLFADDARVAEVPPALRCARFADPAHGLERPIERYVRGLAGLRRDPSTLVLAAIVGIPPSLARPSTDADYEALLAHPDMQPTIAPDGEHLEASCWSPIVGAAYPPVRLVETARGLAARGAHVTLSSICEPSFAPALEALAAELAAVQPIGCLPRPLARGSDGLLDCEMLELAPEGSPGCEARRGRLHLDTVLDVGGARELCRVMQVAPGSTEPGWYYDDSLEAAERCGATPQRVAFVDGAEPLANGETRLVCADVVMGTEVGLDLDCDAENDASRACVAGMYCEVTNDRCGTGRSLRGDVALRCDPVAARCAVPCTSDLDCVRAGELDGRCDLRSPTDVLGLAAERVPEALRDRPRGVCVHPTCGA